MLLIGKSTSAPAFFHFDNMHPHLRYGCHHLSVVALEVCNGFMPCHGACLQLLAAACCPCAPRRAWRHACAGGGLSSTLIQGACRDGGDQETMLGGQDAGAKRSFLMFKCPKGLHASWLVPGEQAWFGYELNITCLVKECRHSCRVCSNRQHGLHLHL